MSGINAISPDKLVRMIGTPACPVLLDVRGDADFAADPRLIPGSSQMSTAEAMAASPRWSGATVVVVCNDGRTLSEAVAAWLRDAGANATILEGGIGAWVSAGGALVPASKLPDRDRLGRTVWVTRARPKIDRIACPWLIRRFVDPSAVFLFVTASEVRSVGERLGAAPFDIEDTYWSHRGELCTFDVMIEEFGLASEALLRLATIVRAADTARLDLAPEAAGLLAASLGLSRIYSNDLQLLDAGMGLYDAFYRWCRDATDETHNWPHKVKARA